MCSIPILDTESRKSMRLKRRTEVWSIASHVFWGSGVSNGQQIETYFQVSLASATWCEGRNLRLRISLANYLGLFVIYLEL